jgi:hypothetical protein
MEDGAGRSWARSSDGRRVRHPLQIGTVGSTVMSWLSVRQLWLMCRVSKTLREFAIKELRAMPQPLVGGGVPGGLETNSLELLSLATLRWALAPPLLHCTCDAAVCTTTAAGGELLIAGGRVSPIRDDVAAEERGWTVTDSCGLFHPRDRTWTDEHAPTMATERWAFRLVACEPAGRVLAIGGCNEDDESLCSVEALDPDSGAWAPMAPMLNARHSFAVGCLQSSGQIVVAGGQDTAGDPVKLAELYDPRLDRWTVLPDVPALCIGAHAGWVRESDGRFYIFGLGRPGSTIRSCYALDFDQSRGAAEGWRWNAVWEADFIRRGHDSGGSSCGACVPVRGGVLLIGGVAPADGADVPLASADLLDEETLRVYPLPNPMHHSRRWMFCGLHVAATQSGQGETTP